MRFNITKKGRPYFSSIFDKFEIKDCTSSICDKINDNSNKKLYENIQIKKLFVNDV